MKPKLKFIIVLAVEFIAIAILLVLVFFAGKRSYDVTFDLNGGTLISGSVSQRVSQGQNAYPPSAVKEGHYLRGWSGSYQGVTSDRVIKAIWEYETSPGIMYSDPENQNFCEIVGCYSVISGEIYIGAYHNNVKVLGIKERAFFGCDRITGMHLLDGILRIDESAFEGCTALTAIDIPSTVVRLGDSVFKDCTSLVDIVLPEGLEYIGKDAFKNCESLESITIPSTVKYISEGAFDGCSSLKEVTFASGQHTETVPDSEEGDHIIDFDDIFGTGHDDNTVTVTDPSKVAYIGTGAFKNCESLENVILPSSLEKIYAGAFSGCVALSSIYIPQSVTLIEAGAFDTSEIEFLVPIKESERPEGWQDGWSKNSTSILWEYSYNNADADAKDGDTADK